jgi:predicted PurR-regulated permease PerM
MLSRIPGFLLVLVLLGALLQGTRILLAPLAAALLLAFLLYPLNRWLMKKGLNRTLAVLIPMAGLMVAGALPVFLLVEQAAAFLREWPALRQELLASLNDFSLFLNQRFSVSLERQLQWLNDTLGNAGNELLPWLGNTVTSFTELLFFLLIVPLFTALILYYRARLVAGLIALTGQRYAALTREVLQQSILSYFNFVKGMVVVYVAVGLLNSAGLALVGLPYPLLLGFVAAVLTFIPYVGIMSASLLPIAMAWVNFQSPWYPLAVVGVFAVVQVLEAYVIFPWAVGSRLQINPLMMLIFIIAGGILWGAIGMILVVPFLGIFKLVADRVPEMHAFSVLLGTDAPAGK